MRGELPKSAPATAAPQQTGLTQLRKSEGVDGGADADGDVGKGGGRAAQAIETTRMNVARGMPLPSWRTCDACVKNDVGVTCEVG